MRHLLGFVSQGGPQRRDRASGVVIRATQLFETLIHHGCCNRKHLTRSHSKTVVRIGSGEGEQALHRIEAVGACMMVLPILDPTALGIASNMGKRILLGAKKITVKREDHLGLVKVVNRPQGLP